MKKNFLLSVMVLFFVAAPISATDISDAPVVAMSTFNPFAQGASDVLFNTFPLASSLIGYGWAQSGIASVAKILGVEITVFAGISALQQGKLNDDGNFESAKVPKGRSYYTGCAAGVGALGLLLAYKTIRCDESAVSILLKVGLGTLVSRITGAALRPLLKKSGMAPEAQIAADLLKHLTVDQKIITVLQAAAIQQGLLEKVATAAVVTGA